MSCFYFKIQDFLAWERPFRRASGAKQMPVWGVPGPRKVPFTAGPSSPLMRCTLSARNQPSLSLSTSEPLSLGTTQNKPLPHCADEVTVRKRHAQGHLPFPWCCVHTGNTHHPHGGQITVVIGIVMAPDQEASVPTPLCHPCSQWLWA